MNSENTMTVRSSFSIENILSKPHKNLSTDNQCKAESATEYSENIKSVDEVSTITGNKIDLKKEPITIVTNDDNSNTPDEIDKHNRNLFTSPDSSGCEEEIGDNLSDITGGISKL